MPFILTARATIGTRDALPRNERVTRKTSRAGSRFLLGAISTRFVAWSAGAVGLVFVGCHRAGGLALGSVGLEVERRPTSRAGVFERHIKTIHAPIALIRAFALHRRVMNRRIADEPSSARRFMARAVTEQRAHDASAVI